MFKLKSIEEEVDFLNLCIYVQTQKYRGRNKRNLYCLVKLQVNTNRAGGEGVWEEAPEIFRHYN